MRESADEREAKRRPWTGTRSVLGESVAWMARMCEGGIVSAPLGNVQGRYEGREGPAGMRRVVVEACVKSEGPVRERGGQLFGLVSF